MSDPLAGMQLTEVLQAIRDDLKLAQKSSDPKNPLIVKDIEVEFQIVATKNTEFTVNGKGKVEVKVLDFFKIGELEVTGEGKGAWAKAKTHKVKMTLSAKSLNEETNELEDTKINDVDTF